MYNKIIAVDFDGTLCENKWPEIGNPNFKLINYILRRQQNGAKIILWTCREGELLNEAVNWCAGYGLIFDSVNANLPEVIEKFGSDCRKISATEYIDDRMNGIFELPYVSNGGEMTCDEAIDILSDLVLYENSKVSDAATLAIAAMKKLQKEQ